MRVVEVSGTPREIGRRTGEALREEFRADLERLRPEPDPAAWAARVKTFLDVLRDRLPEMLEEMQGTAEGAALPPEDVYRLNLPGYAGELDPPQGCTNVAFARGPDGPLLGKNNDGLDRERRRPVCLRVVRPDEGIPVALLTFCGMMATMDGMNAEGLSVGHSSVGSVFQQSDRYVPIRPWAYAGMMRCRTTDEFIRHMTAQPTRGKGYSILCTDGEGATCSLEAPCPLIQVRRAGEATPHMNCVNYYQLPALAEADRRAPEGKANALARKAFLDSQLASLPQPGIEEMKRLLRHHGDPALCRHGEDTGAWTEFSYLCLAREGRLLYVDGNPCEGEFDELTF